jgi:hypothetical protein
MNTDRAFFARRQGRAGAVLAALVLGTAAASGQAPPPPTYPGSCTVSLLNQTARVPASGLWRVTAVPSNTGRVRARLTCVDQGVTRTAASTAVPVATFRTTGVPFASFDFDLPTPRGVEILLAASPLTAAGQSLQAAVVASYTDGSSADVTAAETTLYVTSNPKIATVSPTGLVTAQGSGVVLITVLHEAVIDSVALTVVLAGDDDGDGLPNDYEVANGLLPNDPADAHEDLDGDGLDNLAEFNTGSDPRNADTDGDTLLDGEEVVAGADGFVTNPLLADSDGDGVPDGLEGFVGSDPTSAASVDYGAVLARIDVAPVAFTLIKSLLYPQETGRRLRVTGTLLDGTAVDLTARGVAYASNAPLVAFPGAEPGRVIAGQNGTAGLTASFAGRTALAQVTVQTFTPTPLSFLAIPGAANAIRLQGDYAYIASGATGLYVVDVSDPTAPSIAGFVDTPGNANDLAVLGDFAYVADGGGLQIVDLADPAAPRLLGALALPAPVSDVVVRDGRAYVASSNGLRIVDVSNPAAPLLRSSLTFNLSFEATRGVALTGNLLVVTQGGGGIHVVDISNDLAPVRLGGTHTWPQSGVSSALDVAVRGTRVYVADGYGPRTARLAAIDISVPSTPVVVGRSEFPYGLSGLAFDRNLLFASDFAFVNAVPVFDVDPVNPAFRGLINFSGPPLARDDNGNGIDVRDGLVYVVGNRNYPADNGVTGDAGLHIARYAFTPEDDGVAPTIELTAPADGSSVPDRRPFTLTASASDDVRVEAVEFFVDGVPVGADFAPPFEASFTPTLGTTSLTLTARATDVGGNTATDAATLAITPSGLPVITLLAPPEGTVLPEGTDFVFAVNATDDAAVAGVEFFVDGASLGTVTAPPYQIVVPVAFDVTQVTLTATVHDDLAQTETTGPRGVAFTLNQAPTVQLIEPAAGALVVEGLPIDVLAAAFDDAEVVKVRFFVGGVVVFEDVEAPWGHQLLAPAAPGIVTIGAEAVDARGVASALAEVTVTAAPDPLTTVQGVVLTANGDPVSGITVSVLGHGAPSGGNGRFSIPAVPTNQGLLVASASFAGQTVSSAGAFPIGGGVTDVGTVSFQPNQPPTVAFTTPAPGSEVVAGTPIALAATAADDVAVTKVAFYRNGQLIGEDPVAPFTAQTTAPASPGTLLLTAIAHDAWGATSIPATVGLTVVEDGGSSVTGQVILPDGTAVEGATIVVFPFDGPTGTSGADGRFSISGIPSFGTFRVSAILGDSIGVTFFEPDPSGTTDAGTLVLVPNTPPMMSGGPSSSTYMIGGTTTQWSFEAYDAEEFIPLGMRFYENGVLTLDQESTGFEGGWFYPLAAPPAPATIELTAIAYDSLGALSEPSTVSIAIVALTTVEGLVLDALGAPAVGAEVWVLYPHLRAATGPDGRFSIPEVPNLPAGLPLRAGFDDGAHAELLLFGNGGGVSDIGTLQLSPPTLEAPYGAFQLLADDGFVFVPFADGFTFPYQGIARTGLWLNANGNLTFATADPSNQSIQFFRGTSIGVNVKARLAPLFVDLRPQLAPADGGAFVRQEADRVVLTWYKVPTTEGLNSFQAVLYGDGRIRFAYGAVAASGFFAGTQHQIVVGVTPSGNVSFVPFDWNAGLPMTFGAGQGGAQTFASNNFDLDNASLLFTPNAAGGYDVASP